jgi:methylated-DNA-[protein]-cysteine S-methyltransferase
MKQSRPSRNEYYDTLESPIGTVYLVFSVSSLTEIVFEKPKGIVFRANDRSAAAKTELTEYFEGKRVEFTLQTEFLLGTEFEKSVWTDLTRIPYGETRTYKWLAEKTGHPQASRAVGNALGKNPIPIVFPCHRIIESDGSIGGYSSGVDIKRRLLEIEYYTKLAGS